MWNVILMHLNRSVVQRRPAVQHFSFSTCICLCLMMAKVTDRNMQRDVINLNVSRWECCVVCVDLCCWWLVYTTGWYCPNKSRELNSMVLGCHQMTVFRWCFVKIGQLVNIWTGTPPPPHTHQKRLGNLRAYPMCLQPSNGKGPHPFLWAGVQAECGKVTLSCTPNRLNYSGIFIICTLFTNLVADHIIGPAGPRIGDLWPTPSPQAGMQLASLCS
jgi:hypothetical protein